MLTGAHILIPLTPTPPNPPQQPCLLLQQQQGESGTAGRTRRRQLGMDCGEPECRRCPPAQPRRHDQQRAWAVWAPGAWLEGLAAGQPMQAMRTPLGSVVGTAQPNVSRGSLAQSELPDPRPWCHKRSAQLSAALRSPPPLLPPRAVAQPVVPTNPACCPPAGASPSGGQPLPCALLLLLLQQPTVGHSVFHSGQDVQPQLPQRRRLQEPQVEGRPAEMTVQRERSRAPMDAAAPFVLGSSARLSCSRLTGCHLLPRAALTTGMRAPFQAPRALLFRSRPACPPSRLLISCLTTIEEQLGCAFCFPRLVPSLLPQMKLLYVTAQL